KGPGKGPNRPPAQNQHLAYVLEHTGLRSVRALIGLLLLATHGRAKYAPALAASIGLIPEQAEKERAVSVGGSHFRPIEVPQEGFAPCLGLSVFFRTPNGPDRRVISLNALIVRQEGFQRSQQLQSFVSVMVAAGRKKRPKIRPPKSRLGLRVAFRQVRIKEEE